MILLWGNHPDLGQNPYCVHLNSPFLMVDMPMMLLGHGPQVLQHPWVTAGN